MNTPSPEAVAGLLAELARIPADQTPGDTRDALAEAIRTGEVDNLYQPIGADYWNVAMADVPPYVDPRVRLSVWVAWWQLGHAAVDMLIERYTAQQQRVWAEERQRISDGGQPR